MTNMYDNAKTWNPYKGCGFDCTYCRPSFQAQAKRQKHNCSSCYDYTPHIHPGRMDKIPKADIVFACGNGDISFCPRVWRQEIIDKAAAKPEQTFYFQSKRPGCFAEMVIPPNVILVTTLETNIDEGYQEAVSPFAPLPSERYQQFRELIHPRTFAMMIIALAPEYVWIGYNSRPKQVHLPEPSLAKTMRLIADIEAAGIPVKRKNMREAAS